MSDAEPAPLASAMNGFALDVWPHLAPPGVDAIFAPGSLWLTLALTASGANGATRKELAKALRLPADDAGQFDAAVREQLRAWTPEPGPRFTLSCVSRLFAQGSAAFEEGWLAQAADVWLAPLERVDFAADPERARAELNAWVSRHTGGRIEQLLPPRSLRPDTRLVLVNAVHFLGRWFVPFDEDATTPEPFFVDDETLEVSMMRETDTWDFVADDDAQVVQLTYKATDLSLFVVLPTARDGLEALERRLTPARVEGWAEALRPTLLDLSLPRFGVDPTASMALEPALEALGVTSAFDRERADFTAMSNPANPNERLFVSGVFHQAFIRVDEEGTEAAAATSVVMSAGGAAPRAPEQPTRVCADHPFLYFLRDARTGAWLFMGRVCRPALARERG